MREYLILFFLLSVDRNEKKKSIFSFDSFFTFVSCLSGKNEKKDEIILNWKSIYLILNKAIKIVS